MMRVTPLRRTTLTDSLLTQLRRQILSGRLAPGQQIPPELALCEAYRNVAATGARPLAVTNCMNFGSPEDPAVV